MRGADLHYRKLEGRECPLSLKFCTPQRVRLKSTSATRSQEKTRLFYHPDVGSSYRPITLGLMRKYWSPGPMMEVPESSDTFRLIKLDVL